MGEPQRHYTLQQIEGIEKEGFSLTIPNNILSIISEISSKVGAANYIKTPQFHSKQKFKKNEEDWTGIRNFKITERVEKTGVEKIMQEIRGELNKLTKENFDIISENLLKKMTNELIEQNKDQIAKHIFDIASSNKFYSNIYAILFKKIIGNFEFMRNILMSNFNSYMELFKNIKSADPNKDYDLFCDINKENEKRKAMSQFFVNLMLEELLEKKDIMIILDSLFSMMFAYIEEKNKKAEGVEISENIFIFVTSLKNNLTNEEINEIKEKLTHVTAIKPSNINSMTNKILFKYMDLMEEL